MSLKQLSSNVVELIQSGCEINSYDQAIIELILNSLDAKANSIAVRIDFRDHSIQVIDNGIGIKETDMKLVGQRYMTNKCESISDLNSKLSYYGFRGASLSNLIKISESVTLESLYQGSEQTFVKYFVKNKDSQDLEIGNKRPSQGTTITIKNFMYNMRVRQNHVRPIYDMDKIKNSMEAIALINFTVSFTLRDELNKTLAFKCQKSKSIQERFKLLFNEIISDNLESSTLSDDVYCIDVYISRERLTSKQFQYVFINKRHVKKSNVHKALNKMLKINNRMIEENISDLNHRKFCVFIVNITCPFTTYDITLAPDKSMIFFNNWNHIFKMLERIIEIHNNNNKGNILNKEVQADDEDVLKNMVNAVLQENANKFGASQLQNAVKGKVAKRKKHVNVTVERNVPLKTSQEEINVKQVTKNVLENSNNISISRKGSQKIIRSLRSQNKLCNHKFTDERFQEITLELNQVLKRIKKSAKKYKHSQHKINTYNKNGNIEFKYNRIESIENHGYNNKKMLIRHRNKLMKNCIVKRESKKIHYILERHIQFKPISTTDLIKTFISKKDDNFRMKQNKNITMSQRTFESHTIHNYRKQFYQNSMNDVSNEDDNNKSIERSYNPSKGFEMNISNISVNFVSQESNEVNSQTRSNETINVLYNSFDNSHQSKDSSKTIIDDSIISISAQMEKLSICDTPEILMQNNEKYKLYRRPYFIPKGMSPILRLDEIKNVNSTNDRNYKDDISTMDTNLGNIFSDTYYEKEMYEIFANDIVKSFMNDNQLNVKQFMTLKLENQLKYDKSILLSAKVINQVDNKFISAIFNDDKYSHLVMFDQHAVDERIQLEKLINDYHQDNHWKSMKCSKTIKIPMDQINTNLLLEYREKFTFLGIHFEVFDETIVVTSIPCCLMQKSYDENLLKGIVSKLILDELKLLIDTRGTISKIPKVISDCINSEACRSAIKFGTYLSKKKCEDMIKSLSKCKLPFQCAHGRPSLVGLLNLKTITSNEESTINFKNLKCYKKKIK